MLTNEDLQKINEALAPKFESLRSEVFDAIDSLAQITKKGFDSIEERMVTKVEFNEFKNEVRKFKDEMSEFKNDTNQNLYNLDTKLDSVHTRVKKIEEVIEPLVLDNNEIKKEIKNLNKRLDHLENPVKMKVA